VNVGPVDPRGTPQGRWATLDDRDLLVCACHDREAFAELYRRHVAGVLAYFSRALDRSDLAFDLTAETFAAALLALPSYRPGPAPGRSWLYAIAHNRLVDSVRKGQAEARARDELGMQTIVLTDGGEAAIDRIIARMDGRSAFELVSELPDDQREAITARFLNGLEYSEIAAAMDCSEQVVRKRVSRGLASLGLRLARRSDARR
jgi:RNA polymerase sigma-70 factor (ECF subfamily)